MVTQPPTREIIHETNEQQEIIETIPLPMSIGDKRNKKESIWKFWKK